MMTMVISGSDGVTFPDSTNQFSGGAFSFKNRILNGDMRIDQRNAGASVTNVGSAATYTLDRWFYFASQASKFTVQQNAGSVTPPAGFVNYLGITSSSAYTVGSSEIFLLAQHIEGFNTADLNWGTVNAKTVTLSFWVRSSLTGTFGGSVRNADSDRSYPFSYTISSANTWEQKTVTIVGDTSGTWGTGNGTGIRLAFGLGMGSTFSGTAGAWAAANYISATGATSVVGTDGATLYITGVQLEVGSVATPFERRPFGAELMLCQRYYYQVAAASDSFTQFGVGRAFSGTEGNGIINFAVPMRAKPTFAFLGVVGNYDFSPTAISGGAVPASNTHMTVGMTFSSISSGSIFMLGQNSSSTPAGFTFSAEL